MKSNPDTKHQTGTNEKNERERLAAIIYRDNVQWSKEDNKDDLYKVKTEC